MMNKNRIYLLGIILFALILRINYFIGLNIDDDLAYTNSAWQTINGKLPGSWDYWIFGVRIMMYYPIALFFLIFGVSDFSAGLYILISSIGNILIAYCIGKIIFDEKLGLLSALLLSFFPIDVIYATRIVPDAPLTFFMGLSVYSFLKGEISGKKIYYFLSGIFIGIAWLIKSLAVLIFLFYIIYYFIDVVFGIQLINTKSKDNYVKPKKKSKISKSKIVRYVVAIFVLLLLGIIALLPYFDTSNIIKNLQTKNSQTTQSIEQKNPPVVQNGSEIYEKGIARINAFRLDKNIYWDIETNIYTNRASRNYNGILEDLEYSLHGNRELHSLKEPGYRIRNLRNTNENIDCSKVEYDSSYVYPNIGDTICVKTLEENYAKLKVIDMSSESITLKYELHTSSH